MSKKVKKQKEKAGKAKGKKVQTLDEPPGDPPPPPSKGN